MSLRTAATGDSPWYRTALLGLGVAAGAGLALLLISDIDPVRDLLRDEAASPSGTLLLRLAALGLVAAGACLAVGARRGLPRTRLVTALLAAWAGALLVVAFAPTPEPAGHRWGVAVVAILPALVALLVADLAGRRAESSAVLALRTVALATLAACLLFGAVHGPAMLTDTGLRPYVGLIERVLLGLTIGTIAVTAWVIRREEVALSFGFLPESSGTCSELRKPPGGRWPPERATARGASIDMIRKPRNSRESAPS